MRKIFAAFVIAMTGLGASANASDAQILGRWISVNPVFAAGEIIVKLAFDFKDTTAAMSTVCYYPGRDLEAIVNVPTLAENGKISVQGSGETSISENGMECSNNVQVGSSDYRIENGKLIVTAGGVSMEFIRRK